MSEQSPEEKALAVLLEEMNELGSGDPDFEVRPCPTGITSFDTSTGIGGIPRNRVSIFQGEEHSGKTLLLLTTIARAQRDGGRCAFIDAEHALTPQFARLLGVDWDALEPFVRRPKTLDEAYDLLRAMAKSDLFDVIGFDSATSLTTREAIESRAGDAGARALGARMHAEELPKLIAIQSARTAVVIICQMRENPNPPKWHKGGKLLYVPGGKALKHTSSMTVEIKAGEKYKKGDTVLGHQMKTYIAKNKVGIPYRRAEFDLMYAEGLDLTTDMIDTAVQFSIISLRGSTFYVAIIDDDGVELDERKYAGRAALEDGIRTDESLRAYIEKRVAAAVELEA
jgi:recombination protein RecA